MVLVVEVVDDEVGMALAAIDGLEKDGAICHLLTPVPLWRPDPFLQGLATVEFTGLERRNHGLLLAERYDHGAWIDKSCPGGDLLVCRHSLPYAAEFCVQP